MKKKTPKRYYIRQDTPLKYHKFLWYISLPLSLLSNFASLLRLQFEEASWLLTADRLYFVVTLVLMLAAFIGFCKWEPYGWYSILSLLWVNVAYRAFVVVIYALFLPEELTGAVGQTLVYAVYGLLLTVYYHKRKPLFFPKLLPDAAKGKGYTYPGKSAWFREDGSLTYGLDMMADGMGHFISSPQGEWYLHHQQTRTGLGSKEDEMNPKVLEHWAGLGMTKLLHRVQGEECLKYSLFVPTDAVEDERLPVLFVNHGGGGEPYDAEWYGFVEEAARRRWMVVCPTWRVNEVQEAADRAGMTREAYIFRCVYDEVKENYPMDPGRVYVAGVSGGGNAAAYMAKGCPQLIAAVMPATGAALQGSGVAGGNEGEDPFAALRAHGMGLMMCYGLWDAERRWPISDKLKEMGMSVPRTQEERLEEVNRWISACGGVTQPTTPEQLADYRLDRERTAATLFGINFDKLYLKRMDGAEYCFGECLDGEGRTVVRFMADPLGGHFVGKHWAQEIMAFFSTFRRDPETGALQIKE